MIKNDGLYPIVLKNAKNGDNIVLQPGESVAYINKFVKEGFTYIEIPEGQFSTDGLYQVSESTGSESNYITYLKE